MDWSRAKFTSARQVVGLLKWCRGDLPWETERARRMGRKGGQVRVRGVEGPGLLALDRDRQSEWSSGEYGERREDIQEHHVPNSGRGSEAQWSSSQDGRESISDQMGAWRGFVQALRCCREERR